MPGTRTFGSLFVRYATAAALLLIGCAWTPARADPAALVNDIRAQGCAQQPRPVPPLRVERKLDEAAMRIARGAKLAGALPRSGYRAAASVSIHIRSNEGEEDVARILREQFCREVMDATYREMGSARRGNDHWIVLARPFSAPERGDAAAVARRVLELVNEARAQPRRCGSHSFEAAPPLQLAPTLEQAALAHARDMAVRSILSHSGHDGSTSADRVTRTGYRWRIVGENIAAGPMTSEEVVEGWLNSPVHCSNIMNPNFTEMGVAFAVDRAGRFGIYWAQVFAAPR